MVSCVTVSARCVSNCESKVMEFCNSVEICLLHNVATERVSDELFSVEPAAIHWNKQSRKSRRTSAIDLRVSSE